jgi:hypothetical protein
MEITFNSPMMDGSTQQRDGQLFMVYDKDRPYPFVAHPIPGGFAISHLPSGRRVENCTATQTDPVTLDEAITGFRAQIEIGATNLDHLEEIAAACEVINPDWKAQAQQRAESVRAFTEMSTVHLRPEDLQVIENLVAEKEWESAFNGATGVFVWRGYKASKFCPEPLKHILTQLDTDYVLFDRDAPTHSRFPEFSAFWD